MASPYYTPIDEQTGKSYTDVTPESEDTTGADYGSDGSSGGSGGDSGGGEPGSGDTTLGGTTPDTATRKLRNDAESDPVNPQTEKTEVQNDYQAAPAYGPEAGNPNDTNGSGRLDNGESQTGGMSESAQQQAAADSSTYRAPPAYGPEAGNAGDVNGSGRLESGETNGARAPTSGGVMASSEPTSMDRIRRAERLANNRYPNAQSIDVVGAGGGKARVRVVTGGGSVFTQTLFGSDQGPYPQNEFVDEAYRQAQQDYPNAEGFDITANKSGGVEATITLGSGEEITKTYFGSGDPGFNFNRRETKARVASNFSEQLGTNVSGEDISLTRTDSGGWRASLSESGRRDIAARELQQKLDAKLGFDVGREDFTVVETDQGYTAELSAEGARQYYDLQEPYMGQFGVGSGVRPATQVGNRPRGGSATKEQFGDVVIKDPYTGKRIENELTKRSVKFDKNVEQYVGENTGGPLEIGTEIRQGAWKALNPFSLALGAKEVGEFVVTQPSRLIDIGSEAEPGITGDRRAITAAGGGSQLVAELDRQGVVEVNREAGKDFTADVQRRGERIYDSSVQALRDNPTEAVGEFAGGAAVAYGAGVAASRVLPVASSDISGEAAVRASRAARKIGGRTEGIVSDAGEAAARAPDIQVTRDAEAGLIDVSPELKSQIREAAPSRPSAPDIGARGLGRRSKAAEIRTEMRVANSASNARRRLESVADATPTTASEVSDTLKRVKGRQQARAAELSLRTRGEIMQARQLEFVPDTTPTSAQEISDVLKRVKGRQQARAGDLSLKMRGELLQARQRLSDLDAPSARELGRAERSLEIRAREGASGLVSRGEGRLLERPGLTARQLGRRSKEVEMRTRFRFGNSAASAREQFESIAGAAPTDAQQIADTVERVSQRQRWRVEGQNLRARGELLQARQRLSDLDAPSARELGRAERSLEIRAREGASGLVSRGKGRIGERSRLPDWPDLSGARDITIRIGPARPKRTDFTIGESDLGDLDLTDSPLGRFDENGNLRNPAAGSDFKLSQDTRNGQQMLIRQSRDADTGVGIEKVPTTDLVEGGAGKDLPLLGSVVGPSLREAPSPVAKQAPAQTPELAPIQQPTFESAKGLSVDLGVEPVVSERAGTGPVAGPQSGAGVRESVDYGEALRLDLMERTDTRQVAAAALIPGGNVGPPPGLAGDINRKGNRDLGRGVDERSSLLERELLNPFTGE